MTYNDVIIIYMKGRKIKTQRGDIALLRRQWQAPTISLSHYDLP